MVNKFELISSYLHKTKIGLSQETLNSLEKEIDYIFPNEYREFLELYEEVETFISFETYTKDYPDKGLESYVEKMYNKSEILADLEYRIFLENSTKELFNDSAFSFCLDRFLPIGRTGDYQTCFCIGVAEDNLGRIFLMENPIYLENKQMSFIPLANSLLSFFLFPKPKGEDWNSLWIANFGYYDKSDYIYSNYDIQILEEKLLLKFPYHYSDIIRGDFKFPLRLHDKILTKDGEVEIRVKNLFNYQDFFENINLQTNLIKNKNLVVVGTCNYPCLVCLGVGIDNHKFFYVYNSLTNTVVEEFKGLIHFIRRIKGVEFLY